MIFHKLFNSPKKKNENTLYRLEDTNKLLHSEFYRSGMGTETVAPFLYSFCRMLRPNKILEVGMGYTTPFLINALEDNRNMIIDHNCDTKFLNEGYSPKMVSFDMDIDIDYKKYDKNNVLDIYNSDFRGYSAQLKEKYGKFDFVWFDAGGINDIEDFLSEYWNICSKYVVFHFTYLNQKPNQLLKAIIENTKPPFERLDLVEPHKNTQGSITILKKNNDYKNTYTI